MYCSLDTSCSIARLLIWDQSITTCSILCVAQLVLVARHPFSLDSNKDLTSRYISLPSEGFRAGCDSHIHREMYMVLRC